MTFDTPVTTGEKVLTNARLVLDDRVEVLEDAVSTEPSLRILFVEYHKYLASLVDQA